MYIKCTNKKLVNKYRTCYRYVLINRTQTIWLIYILFQHRIRVCMDHASERIIYLTFHILFEIIMNDITINIFLV